MHVQEILAKSILSRSGITDYCLNPYVGCLHGCRYCYADFMKRYTGHREPWGRFLDARVNAPALLQGEVKAKRVGEVMISSVTDPYNPVEERLRLTRRCLEILVEATWPFFVQTKSPLVLRDMDLFLKSPVCSVGVTITTDDEDVRRILEPGAGEIPDRLQTLDELHSHGVRTFAFVGPILPMRDPEALARRIAPCVDLVYLDRMNYPRKVLSLYRDRGWEEFLSEEYAMRIVSVFRKVVKKEIRVLFA